MSFLNSVRRITDPLYIKVTNSWLGPRKEPLRLHLGCGERALIGYVNIDRRKTNATDFVCDIRRLPYPTNSIDVIENYHVIEHLPRNEVIGVLKEWNRTLKTGGQLVIECPDLDSSMREYLKGDDKRLGSIFGLQRFEGDAHLFGYNFRRLKKILTEAGFEQVRKKKPQDYHAKSEPCMRVECVKSKISQ